MSFVIRWNLSTEMVMPQNLTGGQLCTRSYGTFRFLIFIAKKKTLGRKMMRIKCLWFVSIERNPSTLICRVTSWAMGQNIKYAIRPCTKLPSQWDFVACPFLQIGSILSQTTLLYFIKHVSMIGSMELLNSRWGLLEFEKCSSLSNRFDLVIFGFHRTVSQVF